MPAISKLTDQSSIVLKSDYMQLQEVIKQLEIRLEEERVSKVAAQNERDDAYAKLVKNQLAPASISEQNPTIMATPDAEEKQNSISAEEKQIQAVKFTRVANILRTHHTDEIINKEINSILNRELIRKDDLLVEVLLREELITLKEETKLASAQYIFTNDGYEFLRFWNQATHTP